MKNVKVKTVNACEIRGKCPIASLSSATVSERKEGLWCDGTALSEPCSYRVLYTPFEELKKQLAELGIKIVGE